MQKKKIQYLSLKNVKFSSMYKYSNNDNIFISEEDVQGVDIQPVRGLQYVVTGTLAYILKFFEVIFKKLDT